MTKMFLAAVSLIAASVPAFADEECWPVKKTVWTLDGTAMLIEEARCTEEDNTYVVRDVRRGETREISQDDLFPVDPFQQDGKASDTPAPSSN
ncbi:hypothetical protein [Mesorhizobium sp. 1M-11]|uniref:hypothetical protein n=1 Tax=Mesorhizobium sp. 1M-11 TaxID=1529006 RepID=UPI0006C75C28|nr:hypothetical protein [Mesorhizobium sp. 1M-11]